MPYKISWKYFIEKHKTFHRWFYLIIAVTWLSSFFLNLPYNLFSESRLGVPYIIIGLVPPIIMAVHFIFSNLLSWTVILFLYIISYLIISIKNMEEVWYWSNGVKWDDPAKFWYQIIMNIVIFIIGTAILYFTRPRSRNHKIVV